MRFAPGLVLSCLAAATLWAQSSGLTGSVRDSADASVLNVLVRLVNQETGETYTTQTNDRGDFTFPLLKPGTYRLNAEAAGFKQYTNSGVLIETGLQARLDIRLEIGTVTESVTVEARAPLLKSENASVGSVIDNRTIINMPLIDRRAAQLIRLTGNVVQTAASGDSFAVAGGRGANTMWYIDGSTGAEQLHRHSDAAVRSAGGVAAGIQHFNEHLHRGTGTYRRGRRADDHEVWDQPVSWFGIRIPPE